MDKRLVKISKFMSLVLRHKPETIGITLDSNGWVSVDELLAAVNTNGPNITREMLDEVVAKNDKKRFSYSDDGKRIRASQGHSVEVDLDLTPVVPPAVLYHGTVQKNMESIEQNGLDRMNRQYVHLSGDIETAGKVGQRRGRPVILVIDAEKMHQDGHLFYLSQNGVWLTRSVPGKYITLCDESADQ
jgi:putative RNA 2'-phosphotransferase